MCAQSCLTLCNPMDCSQPGSSVHGSSQGGILEWVAIFFFRESSSPRDQTWVSCIAGRFFTNWITRLPIGIKERVNLKDPHECRTNRSWPGIQLAWLVGKNSISHSYLVFIIARTWKQPRCPSADEWIRKLWYIYTMEYYSAIKKNTFEAVLMRWMKLEPIIQSEVSQKEKHQYSILTHIYGI